MLGRSNRVIDSAIQSLQVSLLSCYFTGNRVIQKQPKALITQRGFEDQVFYWVRLDFLQRTAAPLNNQSILPSQTSRTSVVHVQSARAGSWKLRWSWPWVMAPDQSETKTYYTVYCTCGSFSATGFFPQIHPHMLPVSKRNGMAGQSSEVRPPCKDVGSMDS